MIELDPGIIDAAKNVVDRNPEYYRELTPQETAAENEMLPDADQTVLTRGEVRTLQAYDPTRNCMVIVDELKGNSAKITDEGFSEEDVHRIFLTYADENTNRYGIDLIAGTVFLDTDMPDQFESVVSSDVWRARLLGTLAALADENFGF